MDMSPGRVVAGSEAAARWEDQYAQVLELSPARIHLLVQNALRFYPALSGCEYTEAYWCHVAQRLKRRVVAHEDAIKIGLAAFDSLPGDRSGRLLWAIQQGRQELITVCLRAPCIIESQHLAVAVQVDPSLQLFKKLVEHRGMHGSVHAQKRATEPEPTPQLLREPQPLSQVLGIKDSRELGPWATAEGVQAIGYLLSLPWVVADSRSLEAALKMRGPHASDVVQQLLEGGAILNQAGLRAALRNADVPVEPLVLRSQVRAGRLEPETLELLLTCQTDKIIDVLSALLARGFKISDASWLQQDGVQRHKTSDLFCKVLQDLGSMHHNALRAFALLKVLYLGMPSQERPRAMESIVSMLSSCGHGSSERGPLLGLKRRLLELHPDGASTVPSEVVTGHILPLMRDWRQDAHSSWPHELRTLFFGNLDWKERMEASGVPQKSWGWIRIACTVQDLGIAWEDIEPLRVAVAKIWRREISDVEADAMVDLARKLTAGSFTREANETLQQVRERAQKTLRELESDLLKRSQEAVGKQLKCFWDRYAPRAAHPPIGTSSETCEMAARLTYERQKRLSGHGGGLYGKDLQQGHGVAALAAFFERSYGDVWQLMMERAVQEEAFPIDFLVAMLWHAPFHADARYAGERGRAQRLVATALLSGNRARAEALLEALVQLYPPRQAAESVVSEFLIRALDALPRSSLQTLLERDGEWLFALLSRHDVLDDSCGALLAVAVPSNTARLLQILIDAGVGLTFTARRELILAVLDAQDWEALHLLRTVLVSPNGFTEEQPLSEQTIRSLFSFQTDAAGQVSWMRFLREELKMFPTESSVKACILLAGESEELRVHIEQDLQAVAHWRVICHATHPSSAPNPLRAAPDRWITYGVERLGQRRGEHAEWVGRAGYLEWVAEAAWERDSPLREECLQSIVRAIGVEERVFKQYAPIVLSIAIRTAPAPLLAFVEHVAQELLNAMPMSMARVLPLFEGYIPGFFRSGQASTLKLQTVISYISKKESPPSLMRAAFTRAITTPPHPPHLELFQDAQRILSVLMGKFPRRDMAKCMGESMQEVPIKTALPGLATVLSGWAWLHPRTEPRLALVIPFLKVGEITLRLGDLLQWLVQRREGVEWLLEEVPSSLLYDGGEQRGGWSLRRSFSMGYSTWETAQPVLELLLAHHADWIDGDLLMECWNQYWDHKEGGLCGEEGLEQRLQLVENLLQLLRQHGKEMPSKEVLQNLLRDGKWEMWEIWEDWWEQTHSRRLKEYLLEVRAVTERSFPNPLHYDLATPYEVGQMLEQEFRLQSTAVVKTPSFQECLSSILEGSRRRQFSLKDTLGLLSLAMQEYKKFKTMSPARSNHELLIQSIWSNCSLKVALALLEFLANKGLRVPVEMAVRLLPEGLYPKFLSEADQKAAWTKTLDASSRGWAPLRELLPIDGSNPLDPEVMRTLRPKDWAIHQDLVSARSDLHPQEGTRILECSGYAVERLDQYSEEDFDFVLHHPSTTTPAIIRILADAGERATSKHLTQALELLLNNRIDPRYAGDLLRSLTRGLDGRVIAGAKWDPKAHDPLIAGILGAEHIPDSIKKLIQMLYKKGIADQTR